MKFKLLKVLGLATLGFTIALGAASCDSDDDAPVNDSTNNNENQNNNNSTVEQDNDARKAIYKLAQSSGFTGTYEEWLNSIKGAEVELSVVDNVLKWKYSNKTEWIPLMDMSTLKGIPGDDGRQIELQVSNGFVQWKYDDDNEWTNLYALNDTKGEDGESAYEIYLKYHPGYEEGEEQWISDLVSGNLIKKVTFVRPGNINVEVEVEAGKRIDSKQIPNTSMANYRFDGWFIDEEYKASFNIKGEYVTESLTLYAKYSEITVPEIEGIKDVQLNNTHHYVEAPTDVTYDNDGGRLDVHLNYNAISGVSYRNSTAYTNPVDGWTYTQGELLPTWKAMAQKTRTTIYDASGYTATREVDIYQVVKNNGFKSELDSSQYIDLFYNTTNYINAMGNAGEAVDLSQYLNKMPNFKAFLDANPTIRKTLEVDGGKIYYTPYIEGYNELERMFIMDTSLAQKILDVDNFDSFDITTNGGAAPASNVVQKGAYTPYVDANYNYPEINTKVKVLVDNSTVEEITIPQTTNIIILQNQLLTNGCTGKQLAEQFRNYLIAAYGNYIGKNKIFKNYSDIFCSQSAAYNADELIALMRVIKANPGVITGNANAEVETFFPRGEAHNRVDNIADFMQVWGIQGMNSEKDMLYFDANGKLHDAATTPATYDALKKLSAIYDEGLILDEFWYSDKRLTNGYVDKYFNKTVENSGYGFLMYDFYSQTRGNDMVDGIGIEPTTRTITVSQKGIKPILPPLAYWGNTNNYDYSQSLDNHTNKTLMRYTEDTTNIRSYSWCIPSTTDNLEGALRLMDYMFSEKGSMIQNFGPEAYWQKPNISNGDTVEGTYDSSKCYVAIDETTGEIAPVISNAFKLMYQNSSETDIMSFMRGYLGNTHAIGHLRSYSLIKQCGNAYAQIGLTALKNAIKAGVVNQAIYDKVGATTWDTLVPLVGYNSISNEVCNTYGAVTAFWQSDKCTTTAKGWVAVVAADYNSNLANIVLGKSASNEDYTYSTVQSQMTVKNKSYLFTMADSLGETFVPDYAK